MGFYNEKGRLRVRLSRDVPEAVLPLMGTVIEDLFKVKHLSQSDIAAWIVHPGGRRVLELAVAQWPHLGGKLDASWAILRELGNMSSATILFVLERQIALTPPRDGDYGIMLAMGPGLSVEGALLEWRSS
jgi:alkylresorcinol/alkylpyrone synthase